MVPSFVCFPCSRIPFFWECQYRFPKLFGKLCSRAKAGFEGVFHHSCSVIPLVSSALWSFSALEKP